MRSEWKLGLALCLVAAPFALVAAAGEARTIERIIAVVEGRPVFLSEVRTLERLRGVDRATAVEALIDELLMYGEALRFPSAHATSEEVDSALQSLVRSASQVPGLAESELRRMAGRQATILKYVGVRLSPQIRIEPDAVRRVYDEQFAQRPEAPSFESVSEDIEQRLRQNELDAKIEAWIRTLRQDARIRRNESVVEEADD